MFVWSSELQKAAFGNVNPSSDVFVFSLFCVTHEAKRLFSIWSLGGSVGLTTIDLHGYEAATGHVNMDKPNFCCVDPMMHISMQ